MTLSVKLLLKVTNYYSEQDFSFCSLLIRRTWKAQPLTFLVEGGEGLYLPKCQTNLVFAP